MVAEEASVKALDAVCAAVMDGCAAETVAVAEADAVALVVWVAAAGPKQKELGAKSSVLAVVSMGAAYT